MSPFIISSQGRPGIGHRDEELAETIAHAHQLARQAALLMLERIDGQLVLTDSIAWSKLQDSSELARGTTLALVATQSLLAPTNGASQDVRRIGFAHRAIQEFYLAWAMTVELDVTDGAPCLVASWLEQMRGDERFS
ncbi:hypothetical protein SAMN05216219_1498 [Mycetocola miduiensis]|uniref:Uncharacterized protein n=1 Tax=Mycetocola miduiensis TaxID=995034 RepID=A0A1I5AJ56_9MICO|nr:hypothetical protein SAMN05216219_1498 [Mycetocola miduiensis]